MIGAHQVSAAYSSAHPDHAAERSYRRERGYEIAQDGVSRPQAEHDIEERGSVDKRKAQAFPEALEHLLKIKEQGERRQNHDSAVLSESQRDVSVSKRRCRTGRAAARTVKMTELIGRTGRQSGWQTRPKKSNARRRHRQGNNEKQYPSCRPIFFAVHSGKLISSRSSSCCSCSMWNPQPQ